MGQTHSSPTHPGHPGSAADKRYSQLYKVERYLIDF